MLVGCYFLFLFALTNFLVIVFHCKRKRPAVISFKMENRKERRTKDGFSKYCKVDTVQRHMADPRKLHGTEGFLCLSLLGRLRRRSDKGCSGSLGARQRLQTRGGPCPLDVLFGERAATKEWWPLFAGGPFRSHRPDAWKARTRRATLPARAQRLGSKSQGHRPAHSRKRSWNMGWSWHYCSRVRLRKDSVSLPSALHIRYSSWWRGKCRSPLPPPWLAVSATRWQTGLPKASSLPQDSASAAGQTRSRRPSPSWLLPSSPSLARTGKRDRVRKKPKGSELPLEHTDQTLLARKVLHVLKKQESEMGQCLERTNYLIIPIPETEAQKRWYSYCSKPCHVFPF